MLPLQFLEEINPNFGLVGIDTSQLFDYDWYVPMKASVNIGVIAIGKVGLLRLSSLISIGITGVPSSAEGAGRTLVHRYG